MWPCRTVLGQAAAICQDGICSFWGMWCNDEDPAMPQGLQHGGLGCSGLTNSPQPVAQHREVHFSLTSASRLLLTCCLPELGHIGWRLSLWFHDCHVFQVPASPVQSAAKTCWRRPCQLPTRTALLQRCCITGLEVHFLPCRSVRGLASDWSRRTGWAPSACRSGAAGSGSRWPCRDPPSPLPLPPS